MISKDKKNQISKDEKLNASNLIWLEVGQKKKEIVDTMQTKVRIGEIFKNLRELQKPENNNPKKYYLINQYMTQLEEFVQGTFMSPEEQENHKKNMQERNYKQSISKTFFKFQNLVKNSDEDLDGNLDLRIENYIIELEYCIQNRWENYIPWLTTEKLEELKKQAKNI
jgi:hypothetical protein